MAKLTPKQIKQLYTKDNKLRSFVKSVKHSHRGNGLFRPIQSSHRGGRGTVRNITTDIKTVIRVLGCKYKTGNDAPRGGLNGNYIKVSKSCATKIMSLK